MARSELYGFLDTLSAEAEKRKATGNIPLDQVILPLCTSPIALRWDIQEILPFGSSQWFDQYRPLKDFEAMKPDFVFHAQTSHLQKISEEGRIFQWTLFTNGEGILIFAENLPYRFFPSIAEIDYRYLSLAIGKQAICRKMEAFDIRHLVFLKNDAVLFEQILASYQKQFSAFEKYALQHFPESRESYFGSSVMSEDLKRIETEAKAHGEPSFIQILTGLQSDSPEHFLSALMCFQRYFGQDEEQFRLLFMGPDGYTPPLAGNGALSSLLSSMPSFRQKYYPRILGEMYECHAHFFSPTEVRQTALDLGSNIGDQGLRRWHRSITVTTRSDGRINLDEDDKYSGMDNCFSSCQYFPCKINVYFSGAIEDCKLLNRQNPDSLGEIIDMREVGNPKQIQGRTREKTDYSPQIKEALQAKKSEEAIGWIARQILTRPRLSDAKNWFHLGTCFSVLEEWALAFIAYREAYHLHNTVGKTDQRFHEFVHQIRSYPTRFLHSEFDPQPSRFVELIATNKRLQEFDLLVLASDVCAALNIASGGKNEESWLGMAKCSSALNEHSLALLWSKKGVYSISEGGEASRLKAFIELNEPHLQKPDAPFNYERRKLERGHLPEFHTYLYTGQMLSAPVKDNFGSPFSPEKEKEICTFCQNFRHRDRLEPYQERSQSLKKSLIPGVYICGLCLDFCHAVLGAGENAEVFRWETDIQCIAPENMWLLATCFFCKEPVKQGNQKFTTSPHEPISPTICISCLRDLEPVPQIPPWQLILEMMERGITPSLAQHLTALKSQFFPKGSDSEQELFRVLLFCLGHNDNTELAPKRRQIAFDLCLMQGEGILPLAYQSVQKEPWEYYFNILLLIIHIEPHREKWFPLVREAVKDPRHPLRAKLKKAFETVEESWAREFQVALQDG